MSATMTPVEELRTAAATLRETAKPQPIVKPLAALLKTAAAVARTHETDFAYEAENGLRWCTECNDEECEALRYLDTALAVARVINGGAL